MEKESIWKYANEAVENGASFEVDFESKSLKINKKYVIKNGECERELGFEKGIEMNEIIEMIEALYQTYKYSVPSEREDSKRHHYFKALKAEDLTDGQMCTNQMRSITRLQLELYILIQIINSNFVWTDDLGKWFWQSKNDKDLIILKSWVCGKA